MQKKRFTESQIVAAIKKQESEVSTKDVCRELGISEATLYNWKAKYAGMEVNTGIHLRSNIYIFIHICNLQHRFKICNIINR